MINQEGTVPVVRYVGDIFVTCKTKYTTEHQFPEAPKKDSRIKCKTEFKIDSNLQLLSRDKYRQEHRLMRAGTAYDKLYSI
jgi:hypothetical protein